MLKPNRILAAVAGIGAAGAIIAGTAAAAAAAPTAAPAGDNASAHTTDKAQSGKITFYHSGDKVKVCDSRKGYYAHGMVWQIAGSGSHETWTRVLTLNANNGCVTKVKNLREGAHVKVQVVNKKKGSSKEYSASGFGDGHA